MKIAYIDMQNVHLGTKDLGRLVDRKRFLHYLQNKYDIDQAKLFVGYIPRYQSMYHKRSKIGYTLVFKEVLVYQNGKIKGNVDIDIAIEAMKDMEKSIITQAFLVSGDADYNSLIYERRDRGVRGKLLVPNLNKTLYILRRASTSALQPLTDIKHLIKKETDPRINLS